MVTPAERAALLAIGCPWCGAGPGSPCRVRALVGKRKNAIRSLGGGCHDARWQAALGRPAPVIPDRLPEPRRRVAAEVRVDEGTLAVLDPPEEVPDERPW